jgi:hypothetical protein
MSSIFRRLLTRVIIFERATGNILDLPARRVLSSEVPNVSEDRTQLADGTTRATSRDHSVQLRIIGREESQLARIMADSCAVGMVAIGRPGTRHLFWQEDAILSRVPGAAGALQHADDVVSLESGVFDPAIWGGDLIAGVPWEGTTAEKTDSFAQLNERQISRTDAIDIGRGHDGSPVVVTRDSFIQDAFSSSSFSTDSFFNAGVDFDGTGYVVADTDAAGPYISRLSTSGAYQGGSPYTYPGTVPASLAYYRPLDLCYVVDKDDDQIYVLDGTGSFTALRTIVPDGFSVPISVTIDGDQLLLSTLAGSVEVWDIPDAASDQETFVQEIGGGTPIGNPWAGSVQSWSGMVVQDGVLYGYETGEPAADVLSRHQLTPVQGGDHDGTHWQVQSGASVGITGQPSGVDADTPAVLQTTLPAIGATVRLDNVTGELQLVDWNGTVQNANQSDQIGQSPEVTLESSKYSGLGISTSQIWRLIATVESAAARPELRVVDPGDALGARPGGTVSDCQTRVSSPAWGAVTAIAFDVDADADDQLQISVFDAVGNYVGQISGDGEAVQGTTATFTYDSAGVYTAEMVAQPDFEGVTEATLSGPVDLSTLSLSALVDLTKIEVKPLNGVSPFGTTQSDLMPNGVKIADIYADEAFLAHFADSVEELILRSATIRDDISEIGPNANKIAVVFSEFDSRRTYGGEGASRVEIFNFTRTKGVDFPASTTAAKDPRIFKVIGGDGGLTNRSKLTAEDTTTPTREFFANARSLEVYENSAFVARDLAGTNANGNPVLPPNIDRVRRVKTEAGYNGPTLPTIWDGRKLNDQFQHVSLEVSQVTNADASIQALADAINNGTDYSSAKFSFKRQSSGSAGILTYPILHTTWNNLFAASGPNGEAPPSTFILSKRTVPVEVTAITVGNGESDVDLNDPNDTFRSFSGDGLSLLSVGQDSVYEILSVSRSGDTTTVTVNTELSSASVSADSTGWRVNNNGSFP